MRIINRGFFIQNMTLSSADRSNPGIPARRNHGRGYTLIEIMLVLSIIAVLVAASIHLLTGNLEAAKLQTVTSDLQNITIQLKTYEMQAQFLPSTEQGLDALVNRPTREPVPDRWVQLLKALPKDPWGIPYQYRCPGKHNPDSFDLFSYGPDKVESADDIGNWTKEK